VGDEASVVHVLESLLASWSFVGIDAKGRFGGLVIGWNPQSFRAINTWALNSCVGVDFLVEGLGLEFRVLNVYGPYSDRTYF